MCKFSLKKCNLWELMILKKVGILQIDFLNMGSLLQTTILRTNSKIVGFVLLEIFLL